jgi:hypothetical protein
MGNLEKINFQNKVQYKSNQVREWMIRSSLNRATKKKMVIFQMPKCRISTLNDAFLFPPYSQVRPNGKKI